MNIVYRRKIKNRKKKNKKDPDEIWEPVESFICKTRTRQFILIKNLLIKDFGTYMSMLIPINPCSNLYLAKTKLCYSCCCYYYHYYHNYYYSITKYYK